MTREVSVHPLVSSWGRFELRSFFIDAPEPAIVDTGIASTPAEEMAPALEALGRSIEEVHWILLTHGHIDHIGGAHALWELTGRRARVVIHEADAHLLRSRRAHVEEYIAGRHRYLRDPRGVETQTEVAGRFISGEMEPSLLVTGGETLSLGGDVTVSVHHVPGHTAGSVAYVIDGQNAVFSGDAVEIHGAASGFPAYQDPVAYRSSLRYLLEKIRPQRLYPGHPFRGSDGVPCGIELDREQARRAIEESLEIEARIAGVVRRYLRDGLRETDSPYSPFARVAGELGYEGNPALEPSPFFTTLHGYLRQFEAVRGEDLTRRSAGG